MAAMRFDFIPIDMDEWIFETTDRPLSTPQSTDY